MGLEDFLEYFLWLLYNCITLTAVAVKNPLFVKTFHSEEILQQLFSSALITFAPGLLEFLKSTSPPTIAWFKALPCKANKRWGVYLLVFEKDGHR